MKKQKKINDWLRLRKQDYFSKFSQQQGYRSRAVYKLQDMDRRDRLIKNGMVIVDLGAAPGSWSQYVSNRTNGTCKVIAIDRIAIQPIPHVYCIQGDLLDTSVLQNLDNYLNGQQIDLVISDLAPNITGIRTTDDANYMDLLTAVLSCVDHRLKRSGNLLQKVFEGGAARYLRAALKQRFVSVVARKPLASKSSSKEVYLLARNFTNSI